MQHLATSSLLLLPFTLTAQPVIEYANVALMGTTQAVHLCTNPGTSDPSPDGANVTWDFSSATLLLNAGSTSFVDPAATPYAASYPASNLAQRIDLPGSTFYNYFELGPTQLNTLAEEIGSGDPTTYTDPKTPIEFPFEYQDSFVDYFSYDGMDYSVTRSYTGYGTVILPTGTYTDVVKMTSTSGSIDLFRTDPVTQLVNIDGDGTILVFGDAVTEVAEVGSSPILRAFPVPTSDRITISGLAASGTWELHDMQGRVVQSGRYASRTIDLDLSAVATGPYTFVAHSTAGHHTMRIARR